MAERFNALVLKTSTPKESRVQISTDPANIDKLKKSYLKGNRTRVVECPSFKGEEVVQLNLFSTILNY